MRKEKKDSNGNSRNKIVSASDLFDSDEEIAEKYADESISKKLEANLGDELAIDAMRDTERLTRTINNILSNQRNWIVSEIKKENYEAVRVELKPLDVSRYCKALFEKCAKTLIMSTIYHASTLQRQLTMWRTWRAHNRMQNQVSHRTPIHL